MLERIAATRLFAYGSVFLIQLRAIWGIWDERDLTAGDTSSYFSRASRWADSLELDPVWSPLDSLVYGSLQWPFPDAFDATLAYRLLAVLAATALVLAVLRRLLPDPVAWLVAVWWAILPINFDTLYEVHLFSALPAFAAVLVAASRPGLWGRAAVFGILLGGAFLVRNELIIAAGAWAVAWLGYELWTWRRERAPGALRTLVTALAVPLVAVAAVEAIVVSRTPEPLRASVGDRLDRKHTLNVCQIYAFGYQQRNDDFTGSPWTGCQELMTRDFGEPEPTMTEAIRENPSAMAEHFAWNVRLLPHGLQLMLLNGISGGTTPDYGTVRIDHSTAVLVFSLALIFLVVAGARLLWRDRRRWWGEVVRDNAWAWIALAAIAVAAVSVIVTQRPRPSYLFGLTLGLLAVIGLCALPLLSRCPGIARLRAALPVLAVLVLLLLPAVYDRYGGAFAAGGQPLRHAVDRLEPYDEHFRGGPTRLAAAAFPSDLCGYVGADDPCTGVALQEVVDSMPPGTQPADWLERMDVSLLYADEAAAGDSEMTAFVEDVRADERWQSLSPAAADGWELLVREVG